MQILQMLSSPSVIKNFLALSIVLSLLSAHTSDAKQQRSAAAKATFKRLHLCPSTGAPRGACPGYIVDHIIPLCAGGVDHPSNMQWQTIAEAKAKDKIEIAQCR